MALTYKQVREIAVNQDHIATVQVAIIKAALDISAEAPETPNHANRASLARSVLLNPEHYAKLMVWAVALTAVDTKDAGVLGSVAGVWNAYAGEETKEPA